MTREKFEAFLISKYGFTPQDFVRKKRRPGNYIHYVVMRAWGIKREYERQKKRGREDDNRNFERYLTVRGRYHRSPYSEFNPSINPSYTLESLCWDIVEECRKEDEPLKRRRRERLDARIREEKRQNYLRYHKWSRDTQ